MGRRSLRCPGGWISAACPSQCHATTQNINGYFSWKGKTETLRKEQIDFSVFFYLRLWTAFVSWVLIFQGSMYHSITDNLVSIKSQVTNFKNLRACQWDKFRFVTIHDFAQLTLSSPEAMIRKADGFWCPLSVIVDGLVLACRTSSDSFFPVCAS